MRAILQFDLDSPDDKYDYDCALRGAALRRAANAFGEWLRSQKKYGDGTTTVETVWEEWCESVEPLLED